MKQRICLALFLSILLGNVGYSQMSHFYNVDKEIRTKGKIQQIIMEPRYKNKAPFLIVVFEEKDTNKKYNVEISPVWFFKQDFHKGETLEVVGSIYKEGDTLNIIARQVRFRGETLVLRDKYGFPNWRGGHMRRKGRREGRNI